MKFFRFALPLALVMATSMAVAVPAASSSSDVQQSLGSIKQKVVSIADQFSAKLQQADEKVKSVDPKSVQLDDVKPITQVVVDIVTQVGEQLNNALQQAKNINAGNDDADKRQALLVPAVTQLVTDLNTVLSDVEPLLRHLTKNLELGTVQDLVDGLTPALATLISGVEGLLLVLAPGLSTLVDPLLHTVYALTDALGLPLNLPSA